MGGDSIALNKLDDYLPARLVARALAFNGLVGDTCLGGIAQIGGILELDDPVTVGTRRAPFLQLFSVLLGQPPAVVSSYSVFARSTKACHTLFHDA